MKKHHLYQVCLCVLAALMLSRTFAEESGSWEDYSILAERNIFSRNRGKKKEAAPAIVDTARLNTDSITAGLEDGFLDATALMEYLIRLQVPMRTAHETVGQLVARCESEGLKLAELSLEQFQAIHESIDESIFDVLGTANAVAILQSQGSGGPAPVAVSLARWKHDLGLDN